MSLLFSIDGRMELIACLLFYLVITMEVLSSSGKSYQTRQTAGKSLQKIEMLQQEHKKSLKYYYIYF